MGIFQILRIQLRRQTIAHAFLYLRWDIGGKMYGLVGSSGRVKVRWDIEGHERDYLALAVGYI